MINWVLISIYLLVCLSETNKMLPMKMLIVNRKYSSENILVDYYMVKMLREMMLFKWVTMSGWMVIVSLMGWVS